MKKTSCFLRVLLPLQCVAAVLAGQVVSETGTPIPGARVHFARSRGYVVAKRIGRDVLSWRAAEPPFEGLVTTAADGSFSLPALRDGQYSLCVTVPAGGFLNPCRWGVPVRFTVAQGRAPALEPIRLRTGAVVRIRLNDPQRLLPPASVVSGSGLIVGVRTASGDFHSASVVKEDASGRDMSLTVPFDTPLKLWVFSRHVRVTDEIGRAVDTRGANLPFQAALATPEVRFTLNVSGAQ